MNYDEILSETDFEAFLENYYADTSKDPLEIDWQDLYRFGPDLADAALEREDETIAALRDAADADTVRIHNRPPADAGQFVFEDVTATTCPDCRGDLEYQNRVAVLCTDCGEQFDHFYTTVQHELCTTADDDTTLETVATAPVDDEREIRADGGQSMGGSEFQFSEGDTVLVRVREHGTSGNIVVKFTAECTKIETFPTGRTQATFDLPGLMNSVAYAAHEAEFEVVE